MIVFLTLCYIGVLALLVKFKIIVLNLWWKISPIIWLLFLFIALFIPMQWGAPSGTVTMFQQVVELIPNVSGEVTEVPAKPLQPMKKGDVVFKIDPTTYQAKVDELQARLNLAQINLERAKDLAKRDLAAQYQADSFLAETQSLSAQLDSARWELEKTVVRAPADGYITGLTLRPGQRVGRLAARSWVAFVADEDTKLILGVNQILLRHIKKGDIAEVTFKLLPGKILQASVEEITYMTPQGQLQPSGNVPLAPTGQQLPEPYAVVLSLEETDEIKNVLRLSQVPGGAMGTATVYTESAGLTHIIRRVMMRMEAWLNYINPF